MEILFKCEYYIYYKKGKSLRMRYLINYSGDLSNIPYVLEQPLLYHAHYIRKLEVYYQYNGCALCYDRILKTYFILDVNKIKKDFTQVNIKKLLDGDII